MTRAILSVILVVTVFLEAAAVAKANEPLSMTLADAIRMAGERSVSVLISNERVLRALDRIQENRSSLLPDLTGSVSESRQTANLASEGLNIPFIPQRIGPYNSFDARLSLNQPLFDAASYQRLKQARAGMEFSEAFYAKARNDAMALVANLYLQARRSEALVVLAQAQVRLEKARERVAQTALAQGTGSELAALQASSDLKVSLARQDASRSDADGRRRDLAAALGLDEERPIIYSAIPLSQMAPSESLDEILQEHPDMRTARTQVSQDEMTRNVERAEYWPKASVSANYGLSGGNNIGESFPTYGMGVRLSLPLIDGGGRSSRVKEAVSQLKESQLQTEDTTRHLKAEAQSAREDEAQAEQALKAAQAAFAVSDKQLALAKISREQGSGSDLALEESSAADSSAKDAWESASDSLDMAVVRLAKALGKMDLLSEKN